MRRTELTPGELAYLTEDRRLARLATADTTGRPQVTPVGMWRYIPEDHVIEVSGHAFVSTRKFRNVQANPQAALVVDDVAPTEGWHPRGILLEGPAEAVEGPDGIAVIRIRPDRVASWGL